MEELKTFNRSAILKDPKSKKSASVGRVRHLSETIIDLKMTSIPEERSIGSATEINAHKSQQDVREYKEKSYSLANKDKDVHKVNVLFSKNR